jgi:hypothetical protein
LLATLVAFVYGRRLFMDPAMFLSLACALMSSLAH